MQKLGPLKYFLGIEIAQLSNRLSMTQKIYLLDLLEVTKILQGHTNDTLIEVKHKLTLRDDDPRVEISSYQKLGGKLLYPAHTHSDISYSINILSQFMHSPCRSHFQAALRIMKYLKGTFRHSLTFKKIEELNLEIYSYFGSLLDPRSTARMHFVRRNFCDMEKQKTECGLQI